MKIVDVCEFYSETGGGVRSYVDQKLTLAADHGHELVVVAPGSSTRNEPRPGGRIAWIECPYLPMDRNYRMFWSAEDVWRVLDQEAPDLVEGSSPWRGGWLAGRWQGDTAKALVFHQDAMAVYPYTFFGGFLTEGAIDGVFGWYWNYLRRLSKRFDATVTSGAWLAKRLAVHGLHNPVAVPFGVERERFSPSLRDEALRRDLLARCNVDAEAKLLIAVARFHPEKRYTTVIRGFAAAKRRRPLGLVIVGDGFARASVEREAHAAGNVHMAGVLHDRGMLARYLASADALVHGSSAETYGLVVAESLLSGLPVVVPEKGGAAELAAYGVGERYEAGNASACAEAILKILDRPRGAPPMGAIGTLDDHFRNLFALYEDLAGQRAGRRITSRGW